MHGHELLPQVVFLEHGRLADEATADWRAAVLRALREGQLAEDAEQVLRGVESRARGRRVGWR